MPAFKIYHDPYVTCDEDRYLSQCAFDAAGILCQHRDIIKSLDNSKFKNLAVQHTAVTHKKNLYALE